MTDQTNQIEQEIRALPDPLFGAQATHPTRGEGIVISHFPDGSGEVRFMFRYDGNQDGTQCVWINPGALTFHTPDHPESRLDTLDRVRDALTQIDRLEDDAWTAWKWVADMYEQGRSDAYGHAHTIITEALGDINE